MVKDLITLKSGKVNDYLHHIDVKAYGTSRTLSVFLAEFDDGSVLFDCGSSLDIKKILRYFKKNSIPLSSFKYLITSHHHFDHIGGVVKLKAITAATTAIHPLDWIDGFDKELNDRENIDLGEEQIDVIHTPGHTPGSISILIETEDNTRILFGQDIHRPIIPGVSDYDDYQKSLQKLLDLKADILCEGHFGIFQPTGEVQQYIKKYIE